MSVLKWKYENISSHFQTDEMDKQENPKGQDFHVCDLSDQFFYWKQLSKLNKTQNKN